MIHLDENNLNRFQAVSIPSAHKLFERFGFRPVQGHPDNTDPDHFNEVLNPVGVDSQAAMSAVGRAALRNYASSKSADSQVDDLPADSAPHDAGSDKVADKE